MIYLGANPHLLVILLLWEHHWHWKKQMKLQEHCKTASFSHHHYTCNLQNCKVASSPLYLISLHMEKAASQMVYSRARSQYGNTISRCNLFSLQFQGRRIIPRTWGVLEELLHKAATLFCCTSTWITPPQTTL